MSNKYILEGKTPVPCDDLMTWAKWFEAANRQVDRTEHGDICVRTVFLGLNHSLNGCGKPLLFETMIFGGEHDECQKRCSTWEEAEAMHKAACDMAFINEVRDE